MVLLGGQVSRVDLSLQWLGEAKHNSCGDKAPFLKVAEYLQEIMPLRVNKLWGGQILQFDVGEDGVVLPKNFVPQVSHPRVIIPLVPDTRSQSPIGYGSSPGAKAG